MSLVTGLRTVVASVGTDWKGTEGTFRGQESSASYLVYWLHRHMKIHQLRNAFTVCKIWASLVAQLEKNPPEMQETLIRSLGWEYPLEEGKATHCSILAWRIPTDRGAWRATVHGITKSWT